MKLLPGRTDNGIKNRWNSTVRKMSRVQSRMGEIPGVGYVDLEGMDAQAIANHLLSAGVSAADATPAKPPAAKPAKPAAKPAAKKPRRTAKPAASSAEFLRNAARSSKPKESS